jgi:hypothetical protein
MKASMLRMRKNLQVFRTIIVLYVVYVMNSLISTDRPANFFLSNQDVLKNIPIIRSMVPRHFHPDIPSLMASATSLPVAVFMAGSSSAGSP